MLGQHRRPLAEDGFTGSLEGRHEGQDEGADQDEGNDDEEDVAGKQGPAAHLARGDVAPLALESAFLTPLGEALTEGRGARSCDAHESSAFLCRLCEAMMKPKVMRKRHTEAASPLPREPYVGSVQSRMYMVKVFVGEAVPPSR